MTITVPSGSSVTAAVQLGNFTTTGRLGDCRFSTSAGNVGVDRTGPLRVDTSFGDIAAEEVGGNAEFHTGSGNIRIGEVDGSAVVKNSNGDTMIDTVTGDIRVRSANGAIAIDRTSANVEAKTSNGSIRLGEIVRGSVELATGMGDLEIGIATGTAALLEVSTKFGQVRNLMDPTPRPEASDETVEVHAHTSFGGITIRRS
ncbi:DUF4097 family beta strand repeat-containing protein [Gordonia insulae]|uniref:DUF4097 domain-containing protein n=1 Tax=Gordonia insulae TaxID=2420509 RepID=A0A3G8JJY6_9ACTN|nr:DUF4097 family beta strand repeat-containing protein [Gordonia insulae]AZG44520.1 hypothetical protein D7316_01106 [Gordonia insulae]